MSPGPAPAARALIEDRLNAALGHLRRGDLKSGEAILTELLRRVPGQPNALHLLGTVALQRGRLGEAIRMMSQAVGRDPQLAGAHSDLGYALTLEGRLDEAETHLKRALALRAYFPEAVLNLGNVQRARHQFAEAEASYRRALVLRDKFPEALSNLGEVLLAQGRPLEAEQAAIQSIAARAQHAHGYQVLGRVFDALGRLGPAIDAHKRGLELDPKNAQAHASFAATLMAYGRRAEAIESYRLALRLDPGKAEWRRMLGKLDADQSTLEDAERHFHDAAPGSEARMHLGFHLGKVFEEAGAYERALNVFVEANRIVRDGFVYDPADSEKSFADIMASFSPELFAAHAGAGDPDPSPIFVLGMPRSGTTLIEQILASHPEVFGAGELPLLREVVNGAFVGQGVTGYGALLPRLDDAALARMGGDYVRRLRTYSATARFITDKMPGNFLLIGMIKLMLPNARVIHCVRDPADTAFSIFKNYFAAGQGVLRYAYDLRDVGHYHRLYQALMDHWHKVLPGFVTDISYEALVADQEGETRRLLDAVGLDFRPETLEFFKTERPVHTASLTQVRSPISRQSVGIARRYGARLAPLREALEGLAPTRP